MNDYKTMLCHRYLNSSNSLFTFVSLEINFLLSNASKRIAFFTDLMGEIAHFFFEKQHRWS